MSCEADETIHVTSASYGSDGAQNCPGDGTEPAANDCDSDIVLLEVGTVLFVQLKRWRLNDGDGS